MGLNWGNAATGAFSTAGTGATIGSAIPGVGTGIGAGIGGLVGALSGLFSGDSENDKLKKIATGTEDQKSLHNNILARAMNMNNDGSYDRANQYYNNLLGDNQQEAFTQFSAPYLQQFQEQILPMIAERFAGVGALSSSGFSQAVGGAGAGLQAQLAQLFSSLQSDAASRQYSQFNQLSQTGLNYEPFAYSRQKGNQGFSGPFAKGMEGNMEGILKGIMELFKKPPAAKQAATTPIPSTGGIE